MRAAAVLSLLVLVATTARAEDPMTAPAAGARPPPENRLARERSPYLRQHAHNPVDWWPWGPAAFAEAKRLDRPVFLSIGYAACHWCHVMAHESFEDEAVAAVLDDTFVCVKVDREERPDVDDVYMAAVQLTTGHGGWPMSVFLFPDGRPFLARTYLRPNDLVEVSRRIGELWRSGRERLSAAADEIAHAVRAHAAGPVLPPFDGSDADLVRAAVADAASSFDRERGGFDRRPKFPPHAHLLLFLDRDAAPLVGPEARAMALATLDGMAAGGVHDQVGGGFHRYSTDAEWLLPHFEKMLYDNALLAQAYALAYEATREARHAEVLRGILGWVEREMRVDGGGYASSLDADTDGHEGLTYTWTPEEVRAAVGADDARVVEAVWGVRAGGNYLEESTGRPTGRSILHRPRPLAEAAAALGRSEADLHRDLARVRARLLEVRAGRAQPGRDGKVIVAWNALLVAGFVAAGRALGDPSWTERARALARSLLDRCREGGRLLRFPKDAGPSVPGFLDDHVHLADALLDLADATGDPAWEREARALADVVVARHTDPAGGFYSTADDHEALLARPKDAFDSPIPSPNATAARVLLRLARRTGHAPYGDAAGRTLAAFRPLVARAPAGTAALVRAVAERLVGEAAGAGTAAPDATARTGPVRVDAFVARREVAPGAEATVRLRVVVDAGWHVNGPGALPPDAVATTLALEGKGPFTLAQVRFPPATTSAAGAGGVPLGRYEGTFEVEVVLAVAPGAALGPRRPTLALSFQPCDATSCLAPAVVRVEVPIRVE